MKMADGTYNLTNAPFGYRLIDNQLVVEQKETEIVKKYMNYAYPEWENVLFRSMWRKISVLVLQRTESGTFYQMKDI